MLTEFFEQAGIDLVLVNDLLVPSCPNGSFTVDKESSLSACDRLHHRVNGSFVDYLMHLCPSFAQCSHALSPLGYRELQRLRFESLDVLSNPHREIRMLFPALKCDLVNSNLISNLLVTQIILGNENRGLSSSSVPSEFGCIRLHFVSRRRLVRLARGWLWVGVPGAAATQPFGPAWSGANSEASMLDHEPSVFDASKQFVAVVAVPVGDRHARALRRNTDNDRPFVTSGGANSRGPGLVI